MKSSALLRFSLLLLPLLLVACAGAPRQTPSPVEERGAEAPPDTGGEIQPVPAPRQPTIRPMPQGERLPAIESLISRADSEARRGRLENASALLERALRIDSRDALLWYRLGQIRYQQGDYLQAVNLLRRANDNAQQDRDQLLLNWQLLAKIHAARGDEMSLIEAQRKVRELQ